eukprot:4709233-Prorocentrum_lima.AAC.1
MLLPITMCQAIHMQECHWRSPCWEVRRWGKNARGPGSPECQRYSTNIGARTSKRSKVVGHAEPSAWKKARNL